MTKFFKTIFKNNANDRKEKMGGQVEEDRIKTRRQEEEGRRVIENIRVTGRSWVTGRLFCDMWRGEQWEYERKQ